MKKLEPKFVVLHQDTARLEQTTVKPTPSGVKLSILVPSYVHETGDGGVAIEPAQSVEIHGPEALLKLALAITDFCNANSLMVEQVKAGNQGVAK